MGVSVSIPPSYPAALQILLYFQMSYSGQPNPETTQPGDNPTRRQPNPVSGIVTQLQCFVLLTYPRSAVDAVAPVAVEGVVVIRAVVELSLNDADGLPGEVVGHVPDEREHQYYEAKSVDRAHDTRHTSGSFTMPHWNLWTYDVDGGSFIRVVVNVRIGTDPYISLVKFQ